MPSSDVSLHTEVGVLFKKPYYNLLLVFTVLLNDFIFCIFGDCSSFVLLIDSNCKKDTLVIKKWRWISGPFGCSWGLHVSWWVTALSNFSISAYIQCCSVVNRVVFT